MCSLLGVKTNNCSFSCVPETFGDQVNLAIKSLLELNIETLAGGRVSFEKVSDILHLGSGPEKELR